MKKFNLICLPALLLWLIAGCCAQPEIFQKVHRSLETVQSFYGPLLQGDLSENDGLRLAVAAADSTLLLVGELQRQWCPEAGKVEQLEIQAGVAQKLAQEAGVPATDARKEQGK